MLSLLHHLYFLYSHRDHRYLHSFPTRRSSDLDESAYLPWLRGRSRRNDARPRLAGARRYPASRHGHRDLRFGPAPVSDRKSTRLNSSHVEISYAVFCLKKKKKSYSHHEAVLER